MPQQLRWRKEVQACDVSERESGDLVRQRVAQGAGIDDPEVVQFQVLPGDVHGPGGAVWKRWVIVENLTFEIRFSTMKTFGNSQSSPKASSS